MGLIRFLAAAAMVPLVLFVVTGCVGLTAEQRVAMRAAAITSLEAYNAAGVDPIQLEPEKLAILSATCLSLTAVATVWVAEMPEVSADVLGFCDLAIRAASPAAPLSAPLPPPSPPPDPA